MHWFSQNPKLRFRMVGIVETFGPLDLWTLGPLDLWTFGHLGLGTFEPLNL